LITISKNTNQLHIAEAQQNFKRKEDGYVFVKSEKVFSLVYTSFVYKGDR